MEYVQMTLDDWLAEKEALRRDLNSAMGHLNSATEDFIRAGYRLRMMRDTENYKMDGYKSLTEFAEAEYHIKKSTTSTLMAINKEFSKDGYSMELEDRYKEMGFSILAEMVKLPEQDRELITVCTTRAQIRDLKQFNRQENPEDNPLAGVIIELIRGKKEFLNRYFKDPDADPEDLVYMLNPNGNMTFRKGKYMLFFYSLEQGIKYKVFGDNQNHPMSYAEFFQMIREIFPDEGECTYESFYGEPESPSAPVNTPCGDISVAGEQASKEPEKVENDTEAAGSAEQDPPSEEEPQIPGQKEIEDYPEVLPKGYQKEKTVPPAEPETRRNTPCSADSERKKQEIPEESEIEVENIVADILTVSPGTAVDTASGTDPGDWEQEAAGTDHQITRKDYLSQCDSWEMAVYLNQWYEENPEHAQRLLKNPNNLKRWLDRRMDEEESQ